MLQYAIKFDFYAILLIKECADDCCCQDESNMTIPMPLCYFKPDEIFWMLYQTKAVVGFSSGAIISNFAEKTYQNLYIFFLS